MNDLITIDANLLDSIATPEMGQSFLMVDMQTNKGLQIDYEKLADVILGKLIKDNMPEDGLKLMIVE